MRSMILGYALLYNSGNILGNYRFVSSPYCRNGKRADCGRGLL